MTLNFKPTSFDLQISILMPNISEQQQQLKQLSGVETALRRMAQNVNPTSSRLHEAQDKDSAARYHLFCVEITEDPMILV